MRALAALALVGLARPGAAQTLRASGRVTVGDGPDAKPLAGAMVTLHQVTVGGGGPLDSLRTSPDGRFRVVVTRPDTSALYLVSAEYRGITYFTEALPARQWRDTLPTLAVYDTSSTGPGIAVGQRHIVVRQPAGTGTRAVLELVSLVNRGVTTRISPDSVTPVWAGRLPTGASAFQVGQSDVSAQAIERRGDSVVVTAPIPPGQKQIVLTYALPGDARDLTIPFDQPNERLLVLLEDTASTLSEGTLERRGVQVFDDAQFALFDGAVPSGGSRVVFRFSRGRALGGKTVSFAVAGLVALVLAVVAVKVARRPPAAVRVPVGPETPEALAHTIAVLDAQFDGGAQPAEAVAEYQRKRQLLKARLAAALAARRVGA